MGSEWHASAMVALIRILLYLMPEMGRLVVRAAALPVEADQIPFTGQTTGNRILIVDTLHDVMYLDKAGFTAPQLKP